MTVKTLLFLALLWALVWTYNKGKSDGVLDVRERMMGET